MENKKQVFKTIILPLLIVFASDRIAKILSLGLVNTTEFGPFIFQLHKNHGLMLGTLADSPEEFRTIALSTFGAFLFSVFVALQYFIPATLPRLRLGLSIFMGGILGNIFDRVQFGYVIDSVVVQFAQFHTGIFNVADAWQWLGVGLILWDLVTRGQLLWPENEKRAGKWIDPAFQARYSAILLSIGFTFTVIMGIFTFTYLKFVVQKLPVGLISQAIIANFGLMFLSIAGIFFLLLIFIGRLLSHRIAGPIYAFEIFLENILMGQVGDFKLREQDEFKRFEKLANKFQDFFHKQLNLPLPPLRQNMLAPQFLGQTFFGQSLNLSTLKGSKVWLCFFRYATCPLCVTYIDEVYSQHKNEIKDAALKVIMVFDSPSENFLKNVTGNTKKLLESLPFPLVADPDKQIYKLYRTQKTVIGFFHPLAFKQFLLSIKRGFKQFWIDGELGQKPAHFLLNKDGTINTVYYGSHIADQIPWEQVKSFLEA